MIPVLSSSRSSLESSRREETWGTRKRGVREIVRKGEVCSVGNEKVCGARKRDARDILAFSCPVLSHALRIFFIDWLEGIFFLGSKHEGHPFYPSPVLPIRAPRGF